MSHCVLPVVAHAAGGVQLQALDGGSGMG